MDIDCAILVKVGFDGPDRHAINVILTVLANDMAERNVCLAWNTEFDWIYDKRTPGVFRLATMALAHF